MVSAYSQIHLTAQERLVSLLGRVRILRGRKYPSPLCYRLLSTVETGLSESLDRLREEAQSSPDDTGIDSVLFRQSQFCLSFANKIEGDILPIIDRANNSEDIAPWVLPITYLVSQVVPDVDILFSRHPKMNYHAIPRMGSQYLKKLFIPATTPAAAAQTPDDFALIEMYSDPPAGSLGQALVAHEVGHIISDSHRLVDNVASTIDDSSEWTDFVTSFAQDSTQLRVWLEEFICDLLATCLFGPAYLFAAMAFSSSYLPVIDSGNQLPGHPPWQLRYLIIAGTLVGTSGLGFDQINPIILKENTINPADIIQTWFSHARDWSNLPPGGRQDKLFAVIRRGLPEALRLAKVACGAAVYGRSMFDSEVSMLCQRMVNGLPPNEIEEWDEGNRSWAMKIPYLASVLNAGWMYFLSFGPTNNPGNQWDVQELRRFNGLITSALDYIELRRSWK